MSRPTAPADVLTSAANPRVKAAAALARRKERELTGRYLVEGPRFVADLVATGDLEELFALPDSDPALLALARDAGVAVSLVAPTVLDRIADARHPQGVVAVARRRTATLTEVVGRGVLVVLVGVADPGNAGTVIRTATAAGAAGVVLTAGSVDPWNPKAVRASAGTVARQRLVIDVSVEEVLAACRRAGQRVVVLDAHAAATLDEPGMLAPPVALLFGNEAHGLPGDVAAAADAALAIEIRGPVGSLNLAAAAAVAIYRAAGAGAARPQR